MGCSEQSRQSASRPAVRSRTTCPACRIRTPGACHSFTDRLPQTDHGGPPAEKPALLRDRGASRDAGGLHDARTTPQPFPSRWNADGVEPELVPVWRWAAAHLNPNMSNLALVHLESGRPARSPVLTGPFPGAPHRNPACPRLPSCSPARRRPPRWGLGGDHRQLRYHRLRHDELRVLHVLVRIGDHLRGTAGVERAVLQRQPSLPSGRGRMGSARADGHQLHLPKLRRLLNRRTRPPKRGHHLRRGHDRGARGTASRPSPGMRRACARRRGDISPSRGPRLAASENTCPG